jgi:hypothetical protein
MRQLLLHVRHTLRHLLMLVPSAVLTNTARIEPTTSGGPAGHVSQPMPPSRKYRELYRVDPINRARDTRQPGCRDLPGCLAQQLIGL